LIIDISFVNLVTIENLANIYLNLSYQLLCMHHDLVVVAVWSLLPRHGLVVAA
jgi:hypothetical protein